MTQKQDCPQWQNILQKKVRPAFLAPWQETSKEDLIKDIGKETLRNINALKANKGNTKCFLGELKDSIQDEKDMDYVKESAYIPENITSLKEVMKNATEYFNGMFNWVHPKAMMNVTPPAAIPSVIGNLMGCMFNANIVEQEYSGNIANLEIEVVSMISKLIGYDPLKSMGHFTFGGTGAYLFATKLALTKCLGKSSRFSGIREDAQILVSKVGHYAMKNCSDWTGLGMDNIRTIHLKEDNSMDLDHLQEVMEQCYKEGKPIAMIVATIGTTDAFGIDDLYGIKRICDHYVKKYNLQKRPFIYADAVIGWAWSVFNTYDFYNNPMEFSSHTLEAIKECVKRIQYLYLADGVGIDFHKTGFTCYNCSMVCIKDKEDLEVLKREKGQMAYLYQFSAYTPGEYTLECSRGGHYALSAWCNLKYFGLEGYRAILGNLIESEETLRKVIKKQPSMVCVNKEDHGLVTLFRVYPDTLIHENEDFAQTQYENEFYDQRYEKDLHLHNQYQFELVKELQRMLFEEKGPALSFTSNFRSTAYKEPIAAIKAYPMSPYMACNEAELESLIIDYVLKAKENIKSTSMA